MSSRMHLALLAGAPFLCFAIAQAAANEAGFVSEHTIIHPDQAETRPLFAPVRTASTQRSNLGGGFIEFLFGDRQGQGGRYQQPAHESQPSYQGQRMLVMPWGPQQGMSPQYGPQYLGEPAHPAFDPRYEKQIVEYHGKESPGTIVVDTPNKFLKQISAKREWPDWTPPAEMLARRPDLPRHMEGGPENPLGARAMYLGSSLYRIHGSNEPWTIGTNVSSGCIRMRNEDVIDLYGRVNVGTRVVVI
jgi:lipoprotein-anchoring transpeptidase ErfK/SrfK